MQNLILTYEDPHSLQENPWNPNEMDAINEEKLKNSLDKHGFKDAIKVRELDDGTLQIVGGQHRNRYAKNKGMKKVPVLRLGKLSDLQAKELGLIDNGRYGEDNIEKLADILSQLGSPDELVSILPMDISEFENIFQGQEDVDFDDLLNEVGDLESDAAELDTLPPVMKTHQIMRFKVSVEDAPAIQEFIAKIQKEQGFTESDQLTNAGDALVYGLGTHQEFNHG